MKAWVSARLALFLLIELATKPSASLRKLTFMKIDQRNLTTQLQLSNYISNR